MEKADIWFVLNNGIVSTCVRVIVIRVGRDISNELIYAPSFKLEARSENLCDFR